MSIEFMRQCTRWGVCSVNQCPLDEDEHLRKSYSGDPERTCKELPRHRLAVAAKAKLDGVKLSGLTEAERQRVKAGESIESICIEAEARAQKRIDHAKEHFGRKEDES